jgi:integrase
VDGKRKRKWFYGRTRKDVQQALNKALRDHQQGIPIMTERITVGKFLDRWYEECVQLSPKPTTHRTHRHRIQNHLAPAFGHMALEKPSPLDIQRYIARKVEQGLAVSTINGHLSTLKAAMNQALRWGLIWRNPVALVDAPREEKRERRFLSTDEAKKLLAAARGHRLEALLLVPLTTGLRRSEARGLTWDDVDFENATLTAQRQTIRVDGVNHTHSPKTARSRRIALPTPILAALVRQRERVADERDAMGARWQDHNLIFPSPKGLPFNETTLAYELVKVCARARLTRITPHELRHSIASFCAAANINPRLTMDVLGHSTVEMTMEHYQHVSDTMRREVADSIGRLLCDGE